MLGLMRFWSASITISAIKLMHRIGKSQFKLGKLRVKKNGARNLECCSRGVSPATLPSDVCTAAFR
jgi:hypothetical protein